MDKTNPNWTATKWPPRRHGMDKIDIDRLVLKTDWERWCEESQKTSDRLKWKKRWIVIAILAFWVFCVWQAAHASTNRVVDFSWTYDTTVTDLKGFNIYMDDKEIASIPDPKVRQYTHTFNILNDANTCFTMKAFDIAGQPSPMSPQVCIDAPPPGFESFSAKERPARATGGTGTNTITKPSGAVVAPVK